MDQTSDRSTDFPSSKKWDHSPLRLPVFYRDITAHVSAAKSAYRSLVKNLTARARLARSPIHRTRTYSVCVCAHRVRGPAG